ncbi:hypothetical protein AB205_0190170, partial [Aquarana catesbeiana]
NVKIISLHCLNSSACVPVSTRILRMKFLHSTEHWYGGSTICGYVHRLYRSAGCSFQKAQDEWVSGTWKSPPTHEEQYSNFTGPSLPQYPTVPNYPAER